MESDDSARNRRFLACNQNAKRSDDIPERRSRSVRHRARFARAQPLAKTCLRERSERTARKTRSVFRWTKNSRSLVVRESFALSSSRKTLSVFRTTPLVRGTITTAFRTAPPKPSAHAHSVRYSFTSLTRALRPSSARNRPAPPPHHILPSRFASLTRTSLTRALRPSSARNRTATAPPPPQPIP